MTGVLFVSISPVQLTNESFDYLFGLQTFLAAGANNITPALLQFCELCNFSEEKEEESNPSKTTSFLP